MLGYVGLCKAIERNVFHILANGEPLYDAYTTYLPYYTVTPLTTLFVSEIEMAAYDVLQGFL